MGLCVGGASHEQGGAANVSKPNSAVHEERPAIEATDGAIATRASSSAWSMQHTTPIRAILQNASRVQETPEAGTAQPSGQPQPSHGSQSSLQYTAHNSSLQQSQRTQQQSSESSDSELNNKGDSEQQAQADAEEVRALRQELLRCEQRCEELQRQQRQWAEQRRGQEAEWQRQQDLLRSELLQSHSALGEVRTQTRVAQQELAEVREEAKHAHRQLQQCRDAQAKMQSETEVKRGELLAELQEWKAHAGEATSALSKNTCEQQQQLAHSQRGEQRHKTRLLQLGSGVHRLRQMLASLRLSWSSVSHDAHRLAQRSHDTLQVAAHTLMAVLGEHQHRHRATLCNYAREVEHQRRQLQHHQQQPVLSPDFFHQAGPAQLHSPRPASVWVMCRVRPPLHSNESLLPLLCKAEESSRVGTAEAVLLQQPGHQQHTFQCMRAFGSSATQEELWQAVQPRVQGLLQHGNDVLVAMLGQQASGKSHSLHGVPGQRGLLQSALAHLFCTASEHFSDYECQVRVSLVHAHHKQQVAGRHQEEVLLDGFGTDARELSESDGLLQGVTWVHVQGLVEAVQLLASGTQRTKQTECCDSLVVVEVSILDHAGHLLAGGHIYFAEVAAAGEGTLRSNQAFKSMLVSAAVGNAPTTTAAESSALVRILQQATGALNQVVTVMHVCPTSLSDANFEASLRDLQFVEQLHTATQQQHATDF